MDFSLTNEQIDLHSRTLAFARETLGGNAADWRAAWQACADFGLLGCATPQAYGGEGYDTVTAVAILEALGQGCPDNGLTLAVNGQIWAVMEPVLAFGTDAQKQRYLPALCDGRMVGAHGMTEKESGSDAFALKTRAERRKAGYVLNGKKIYIGMGPVCDLALVFASTDPSQGRWGLSAFLVEASDPGFDRGSVQEKMGLQGSLMGTLTLRDCWVPEHRRLGDEGDGASIFQHSMEWERSFIFASHVGSMARQLEDSVAFARGRKVFGQSIDGFQSVSNRLADMRLRLELSRMLLYKAAWLKSRGEPCALEAAMAKLQISEAFVASSQDALRIRGGEGYMSGQDAERDLRDALGGVIYSGTSDIQRQIIASLL